MNVIKNSMLIEFSGGFPEAASPFPTPVVDPSLVDTWEIVICLDFTVYTMIPRLTDLNTRPLS
jgi:hypothetical protein